MKTFSLRLLIGLISVIFLSCAAHAIELKDTNISYIDYREVSDTKAGIVYKIMIENTGKASKTYEFIPDSDAVRKIGTYRIDPSSKITLRPGQEQTISFYLSIENEIHERAYIPLQIKSGANETTNLELALRSIVHVEEHDSSSLNKLLKIAFYVLVALIFIGLIVTILRRSGKKKDEGDKEDTKVETYY